MNVIKELTNGEKIIFDTGKFDDWCVFVLDNKGNRHPPRDIEYFARLIQLAEIYGAKTLYAHFVKIYEKTSSKINRQVVNMIKYLANKYPATHSNEIEKLFTIIYAGMVAEENKQYAILKKRIKRLGIYQILIQKKKAAFAANYSRGKNWRQLDKEMKAYGF